MIPLSFGKNTVHGCQHLVHADKPQAGLEPCKGGNSKATYPSLRMSMCNITYEDRNVAPHDAVKILATTAIL